MTSTRAQEKEEKADDKAVASTAVLKAGDAAKGAKATQAKEKVLIQPPRDGECVEEPDCAEVHTEMFKVSMMQGNLEERLKEVNRSIHQFVEKVRLAGEKANANTYQMVSVQLFGKLSSEESIDAGKEARAPPRWSSWWPWLRSKEVATKGVVARLWRRRSKRRKSRPSMSSRPDKLRWGLTRLQLHESQG
ncbi:unnamed protein product [Linum trigynum]|uniref:Uncharacterized protein n=1 Tax=Linum trigynum TaxID=586398 RepID=A0AAV2FCD7_9ROSI